MPRGSKPGERRGGRQRATPNKRTVLRDRILAVASGNPTATFLEFVPILVGDQALPDDIRIAIARKVPAEKPSKTANARARKTKVAKAQVAGNKTYPKSHKGTATTFARLDLLLSIVRDEAVTEAGRRKAASELAEFFLPKSPGWKRIKFPADEFGFSVDRNWLRSFVISGGKSPAWPIKEISFLLTHSPKRLASFTRVSTQFAKCWNLPTTQNTIKKQLTWTKSGSRPCVRGARPTSYSAQKKIWKRRVGW